MTNATLTKTRLKEGIWQGVLVLPGAAADAPDLKVTHLGKAVPNVAVTQSGPGQWIVQVPIPAETIADGVQTFVVAEAASGVTLASFAIMGGDPLAEDIRAEIDLLRAELDLLKRAFRRHCVETL